MSNNVRWLTSAAIITATLLAAPTLPAQTPQPTDTAQLQRELDRCRATLAQRDAQIAALQRGEKTLDFRAMLAMYGSNELWRWDPPLSDTAGWNRTFTQWKDEGYNAVLYWVSNELFGRPHALLRL